MIAGKNTAIRIRHFFCRERGEDEGTVIVLPLAKYLASMITAVVPEASVIGAVVYIESLRIGLPIPR